MGTAKEAVAGVDVIYCDSWMSYGIPKDEEEARKKKFMPFQVDAELLKLAKPDCIFMNCLPAARGMEQTAEVIDGPQSVVFDQAENRLHAQKSMLVYVMAPTRFSERNHLFRFLGFFAIAFCRSRFLAALLNS